MNKSKISVIIPMYNCENTIEKCIMSILNQTYKNFELIIVDDGSTDDSVKKCNMIKNSNSQIKIFSKKNGGVSSTRNYGLKKATGDYIFFIDGDDYLDQNVFEILINNKKDNALIGASIRVVEENSEKDINYSKNMYMREEFIENLLLSKVDGFIWRYLLDRKKIDKLEFDINTSHMEDTIFLIQYLKKVDKVMFFDNCRYNYFQTNNSITRATNVNTILSNINDFNYSLEKIKKILDSVKENKYSKYIIEKKVKLIKYELSKGKNKKFYDDLFSDLVFQNIIYDTYNKINYSLDKFLLFLIINKYSSIFSSLVFIKKKIKNFRKV